MQINHHFHGADFHSLSEMFDPARNVEYAANFLKALQGARGLVDAGGGPLQRRARQSGGGKTYVCSVIRNMVASGFGQWTANARALCQ